MYKSNVPPEKSNTIDNVMVYTATDGTQFEDRNEWRKYEFETNYTFKNKTGESLMKVPGNVEGQPFDLADLESCEVLLLDHSDQVQADNLTKCRVFIGSSSESVFIRNCTDCVFTIACKQLRTRDCVNCEFYLYSQTDPIIETSSGMRFAPFNGAYSGLPQHFQSARLDPTNNHWARVYDFNDPDKSGKNWSIMAQEEEAAPWIINLGEIVPGIEGSLGAPQNPVARDAQATIYDDDGNVSGMQAFSFDTSQQQAQESITQEETATTDAAEPVQSSDPFGDAPPSQPTSDFIPDSSDPFAAPTPPVVDEFVPPPAAPVSAAAPMIPAASEEPESWPKLEAFEADLQNRIAEKKAKEATMVREVKKKAEESLDKYYGERTDRLAHRASTNREQEAEKVKTQKLLKEKSSEQPWTRVLDLVDTNTKSKKKSDKSSEGANSEEADKSRMKSILVQLKNSGGLEVNQA